MLLVGCGSMAGAIVQGWRKAGLDVSQVVAVRPSGQAVDGIRVVSQIPADFRPRVLMLGIKPQKLDEVVDEVEPLAGPDTIIVSLLAGTEIASLSTRFPRAAAIVRAMPNLAVAEGQGVTALSGDKADADTRAAVGAMFDALGVAPWVDEDQLGSIGIVAGSGPAWYARLTSALAATAEDLGLSPDLAHRIAVQTLRGTGAMVAAGDDDMAALARRVASPGGTTEAGLAVLDGPDGLRALMSRMAASARARGMELAVAARSGRG